MASSSSMVPLSSSNSTGNHHVYISYRRVHHDKELADIMNRALAMLGVSAFNDPNHETRKQTGISIDKELREAMLDSTICVVLLTKDYVASSWCLEELVKIVRCREENGMIVLPVFYDVDPSDVRKQRGVAAAELKNQIVGGVWWRRWKNALETVGGLCGWDFASFHTKSESLLVGNVVRDIADKQFPTNRISIYPLTYDTCNIYLKQFLQMGWSDVLMVGICGQSKMGKTTLAKAVYNQIFSTFDGSSFLANVGQSSKQPDGLPRLQEKLLHDILSDTGAEEILDTVRGMAMIQETLCFKRVLIVLDDVDDLEQLFALVGSRSWFGPGSKIIITTKNMRLLKKFRMDQIYMAQGMPLPDNIEEIWEPFQQTNNILVGLGEYIDSYHRLTSMYVKYLEQTLLRERRKNALQKQVQSNMTEARSKLYLQNV